MVCKGGAISKEGQEIWSVEAETWKRVEGIMCERMLKKQLIRYLLETCVITACIYV